MRLLWDQAMSYTSQCIGKIVFKYIEKVDYQYYFILKCVVTPGQDYLFGQPKAEGESVLECFFFFSFLFSGASGAEMTLKFCVARSASLCFHGLLT